MLGYLLWIISSLLLLAGMVLPMFSFHKFYIFDHCCPVKDIASIK